MKPTHPQHCCYYMQLLQSLVTNDTSPLLPTCSETSLFSHFHHRAPVTLSFQHILKANGHVRTTWIAQFLSPAPIQTTPRKTSLWVLMAILRLRGMR